MNEKNELRKFYSIIQENPNSIITADNKGIIDFVNKGFEKNTGYRSNEICNNNEILFSKKFINSENIEFIKKELLLRKEWKGELLQRKKNNQEYWEFVTLKSILDKENQILYYMKISEDISNAKKNEHKLKLLFHGIEQSPANVIIIDKNGIIEYVNLKFTELTGLEARDVVGKKSDILKSSKMEKTFFLDLKKTLRLGKEWQGEICNSKKNGEYYWENVIISPIENEIGEIVHFMYLSEDITEKKNAEESLKKSEEILRKKNQSINKELEYAYMVVKRLIPTKPLQNEIVKISYKYKPLDIIGGDFFSFKKFKDKSFGFFIGDVSGHGVSAALFLSLVKGMTEKNYLKFGNNPLTFMNNLNYDLLDTMSTYFLTGIYGVFKRNKEDVLFTFVRGAHPPPILMKIGKLEPEILIPVGKPIGVFDDAVYESMSVKLQKGDRLYVYTDGVNETMNENSEILGFERLSKILLEVNNFPLEVSIEKVIDFLNRYRGKRKVEDDILFLGFEIM